PQSPSRDKPRKPTRSCFPAFLTGRCVFLLSSAARARVAPEMADDARALETRGFFTAIRRTLRLLGVMTWTPITVGWRAIPAPFWRGDRRVIIDRAKHAWAIGARWVLGIDMHFVRGDTLPPRHGTKARLVVANHRTPLDIVSLMWLFDGHFLANHKTRTA